MVAFIKTEPYFLLAFLWQLLLIASFLVKFVKLLEKN